MRRPLLTLGLAALVLAGCGGGGKKSSSTASTAAAAGPPATSTSLATKPTVAVPKSPAPRKLVSKDIVVGTGATAQSGDTVSVHYVGVLYANGRQFDSSWDRHQPFTFPLGGGQVIPGWDQGIAGMKVNGRRELVIPPDLAYGAQGQPPTRPPN